MSRWDAMRARHKGNHAIQELGELIETMPSGLKTTFGLLSAMASLACEATHPGSVPPPVVQAAASLLKKVSVDQFCSIATFMGMVSETAWLV